MMRKISVLGAALHSCVLLLCCEWAQPSTVFGTENGYDVGGTDPICWVSNLSVNPEDATADNYTSIETLNQELFGDAGSNVTLLPSCFEGTDLTMEPMDLGAQRQLITGTDYTFRLTLSANVTAINEDIFFQALEGRSTIHVRLQLCDAIKQGFCNPLWDSRQLESELQPSDTDLGADPNAQFPDDSTKWKYDEETQTLLGIDDGPLVFSRWVRWTLKELSPESPAYVTSVDITFQLPVGIRSGAYFFIGHAVMNFDLGGGTVQRIDVAEAIPDNVVEVRDPPTIYTVSDAMKIALAVATAVFAALALLLFLFIICKRHHPVMKLTQGSFLAAMTGACLVQIACTFTFLPTEDVFCELSGPLVLVPMTFVGAVCVGRIWRVYKTLSFAQNFAQGDKKRCSLSENFMILLSSLAALPFFFLWWRKKKGAGANLRQSIKVTVSAEETVSLICMLTLPQLVVQVVSSAVSGGQLEIQLDSTGNIGRVVCDEKGWAFYFGICYLAFVYLLAVFMAWISRSLPSAFNEKDQIFNAASISTLLAFMTISLGEIINDPTTHPDVQVFLLSLFSIGIATSILILVVLPKVRRVMSGEKVVMSTLLGARYSASTTGSNGAVQSQTFSSSLTTERDRHNAGSNSLQSSITRPTPPAIQTFIAQPVRRRIKLKDDDPLPEIIEQKILDVQTVLSSVTAKLSEGRPLSVDELALLQEGVAGLHEEIDLVSMDDSSTEGPTRRSTEGSTTRSVSFDPKKDTQIANNDHKEVEIDHSC